ncbi:MAG: RibD family protein, partial [Pseudolabrys sp.]
MVVGQIGQSLDGRIATETGHSKYINGPAGLAHLHRLRALVDGVLVGVGTAIADDPQLTVRRVSGPQPVRVVIDPKGRLSADARIFAADGVRRLLIVAQGAACRPPPGVEVIA